MVELYTVEIHAINERLTILIDRMNVLRETILKFEEAAQYVQQQVPGSFRINYDVTGNGNGVILASM